jgi:SAM-dependent methyltransferase
VYYDRIAKQWHRVTGHHGGAFKRYVLNDLIIGRIGRIEDLALLELGAGNGYFAPLLLRRCSGQIPARIVISDQSPAQLEIARTAFHIDGAEYLVIDVQDPFPFADASFDLILAIMLLNELPTGSLQTAVRECRRMLGPHGRLIAAVPHPDFVRALARKGALTDFGRGLFATPSAQGLRLPVSRRATQSYRDILESTGFGVTTEDILPNEKTRHEKPGLTVPRGTPLALLLECGLGGMAGR